jgi:hypothetical protein
MNASNVEIVVRGLAALQRSFFGSLAVEEDVRRVDRELAAPRDVVAPEESGDRGSAQPSRLAGEDESRRQQQQQRPGFEDGEEDEEEEEDSS